ncbi:MAG TPA: glycoside hydrolase family 71/99-like protein [Tepidisphaeraceae bacterium]|nr:glycoside hydrolase family 71/99-like protein [Tepidisphaeraceae bacterium]
MRVVAFSVGVLFFFSNLRETRAADPPAEGDPAFVAPHPYSGESAPGVDPSTMTGKVLCGYQGWFTAEGDGAGKGWTHYANRGGFAPGKCCIDLWPDLRGFDADECFATPFLHADGSAASVFSSDRRKTVLRHFQWMKEYGIDGVFVQRFIVDALGGSGRRHCDVVLDHCREGANRSGRTYAVMYDLSGLGTGQIDKVIDDWKRLVDRMRLTRDAADKAYLHHNGKPVVAVWGIGFNDHRRYSLEDCRRLIDFLKDDPTYGGCTVMAGVPMGWRTLDADAVADKTLLDVIGHADVISPWTVGRYDSPQGATRHAKQRIEPDLAWCKEHDKAYIPVVFPGFSWHNLNPRSPLDQIPRRKGQFLWTQVVESKKAGATMLYVAMFDEMNEGTAIFKCTNDPPAGESRFLTLEGLPTDHYLWLTGMGGRILRGEAQLTDDVPPRH